MRAAPGVTHEPVSELVKPPIEWVRGDDARLGGLLAALAGGQTIGAPIRLLVCGCGKTYMLADGGHRITAAHRHLLRTGVDLALPVERLVAPFP